MAAAAGAGDPRLPAAGRHVPRHHAAARPTPTGSAAAIDELADRFADVEVDRVVGVEARGFILAAPIAYRLGAAFVPVRKAGKLPWAVVREEYELEYGADKLEIHRDAIHPDERVLVIDDVLATGGTAAATARLSRRSAATSSASACSSRSPGSAVGAAFADRRLEVLASY